MHALPEYASQAALKWRFLPELDPECHKGHLEAPPQRWPVRERPRRDLDTEGPIVGDCHLRAQMTASRDNGHRPRHQEIGLFRCVEWRVQSLAGGIPPAVVGSMRSSFRFCRVRPEVANTIHVSGERGRQDFPILVRIRT